MSVSVLATLRPLHGACLASARAGILSIRVSPRCAPSFTFRATVPIQPLSRHYSSELKTKKTDATQTPKPVQAPVSFRQFVGRLLAVSLRNLGRTLTPSAIRKAYRDAPLQMGATFVLLICGAIFCAVMLTRFFRDFYNPYFSAFPEPVANTLRRAIYYTNYKPEPELALKYYKRALEESQEIGMHPFSDEVLGIRIQVSAWLEKIGQYNSAIEVLEGLLSDCTRWVEKVEQLAADGEINAAGRLIKNLPPSTEAPEKSDASQGGPVQKASEEPPETLWRTRERVLAKAVAISTKLGETYASEHVLNPEKSHENLLWAVETTLKEFARRRKDGTRPGEQSWLSPAETGGTMESLGNAYERKGQFHLAIPLFFQALRLCDSPCHRATIMNNLAASFAQFPLYSPTAASDGSFVTPEALKEVLDSSMPTSRQDCLEAGLNWVRNAYQHGKDVKGEERTPECDEACAVALYNWGDIARMLGKPEMARKKYEQAIKMSTKMEFAEGVRNGQEGLKKLASVPPSTS